MVVFIVIIDIVVVIVNIDIVVDIVTIDIARIIYLFVLVIIP